MTAPSLPPRRRAAVVLLALALPALGGSGRASTGAAAAPPAHAAAAADATARPSPSQLVVISTTDVKGKSSPCGCHTPKGGLARRAALGDSLRKVYGQVLVVDSGGFFPEEAEYEAAAAFMMDAMKDLGVVAAGVGESDLRYGRGFLLAQIARTKLPVTCANLFDRASGKSLVAPWILHDAGRAKVGFFGLITNHGNLGPSVDSLRVTDPLEAAQATVAALKAKGATVIVLLSELGKVESEEVANVIPGIDLVIAGRKVPLFEQGRRIAGSLVVYGGEQSHYAGRTILKLDPSGHVAGSDAEMVMLGPDVPEDRVMFGKVKRFEDAFNDQLRKLESKLALESIAGEEGDDEDELRDHYVGAEVCGRCHKPEYDQWKTTAHSRAWSTLVEHHSESRTDCQPCHTVGFGQPGGFRTDADAAKFGNVQCENCHGMGTQHDATRAAAKLTALTCRKCHDDTSSPYFSFEVYEPHILHHPPAVLPPLPPRPKVAMQ